MKDFGLVSIITSTYNSSRYIKETIKSIISQTYDNWELIITDDCSTDNTVEVINESIQAEPRIKLFRLSKNSGAGVSRNNSIRHANGRFIAFCDDDDRWLPNKLDVQLTFMNKKRCVLSYSSYYTTIEGKSNLDTIICKDKINFLSILKDNGIGCLTAIYDSKKTGKVYMPTIRKRQDWGLWISIIKKHNIAYGIKEPLAIYRIRKNSMSSNKLHLIHHNVIVYKKILGYSTLVSWIMFIFLFTPTYIKKKITHKINNYSPVDI